MNDAPHTATDAEPDRDTMAQLIHQAGPRRTAPPLLRDQVYQAVHQAWQQQLAARQQQRQRRWLAAAASVLVVAVGSWLALRTTSFNGTTDTTAVLATVVDTGQVLRAGDTLTTTQAVRLNINGMEVRAAAQSTLQLRDATHVQLTAGALYLNSRNAAPLTINTTYGDVTHLGTRYLVAVDAQRLTVGVREGKVSVTHAGNQYTLNASERLTMNQQGNIERSTLMLDDSSWLWADMLASAFELDNRSLADFLQWITSETGYPVRYQNLSVQQQAEQTVLHGARTTQPPLQALRTILATTDLKVSLQNGEILIQR